MEILIFLVIIGFGVSQGLAQVKKARKSVFNASHTPDNSSDWMIWYEIGRETNND